MPKAVFDHALAQQVCAYVADGVPLRAIVAKPAMPAMATILDWLGRKDFRGQLVRARALYAETLLDDVTQIVTELGKAEGAGAGEVALAKLRIDALKWLVERLIPEELAPARPAAAGDRPSIIKVVTGVPRRAPKPLQGGAP